MLTLYNIPNAEEAAQALLKRLVAELSEKKRVLWLVPGGSNIPLSVSVMREIPAELQPGLAIMLTDERYGDYNHPDSNTRQLREAGFETGQASVVSVLTPENKNLADTCKRYNQAIKTAFAYADSIIGQFGMGADGHIAGMLPHSPAVHARTLVAGYDAGNFIRITLTPPAIQQIHAAYAFVYGEPKRPTLENLLHKQLTLTEQPAQILKRLPESYVYNDQLEGSVS